MKIFLGLKHYNRTDVSWFNPGFYTARIKCNQVAFTNNAIGFVTPRDMTNDLGKKMNCYLLFFQPPLVQACFHGDPDEVRALLYKKEDVNYQVCLNIYIIFLSQSMSVCMSF